MALTRHKSNPFKLLVWLLYHEKDFIIRETDGSITLMSGPCSRILRTTVTRLWTYVEQLAQAGYIVDVTRSHGKSNFTICEPIFQPMNKPLEEGEVEFVMDDSFSDVTPEEEEAATTANFNSDDPWKLN